LLRIDAPQSLSPTCGSRPNFVPDKFGIPASMQATRSDRDDRCPVVIRLYSPGDDRRHVVIMTFRSRPVRAGAELMIFALRRKSPFGLRQAMLGSFQFAVQIVNRRRFCVHPATPINKKAPCFRRGLFCLRW